MAAILSVRADEELQERFKAFAENGDFRNNSEFLSHLLTLYSAQKTSIRVPTLEGAINAITDMADRACKILVGTGETIVLNQDKLRIEAEGLRQEAEERIKATAAENESLRAQNEDLSTDLELTQKSCSKTLFEREEHIKNLEKILADKSNLNDEYRKDIERLEAENKRQMDTVTNANSIMNELDQLRQTTQEQGLTIKGHELDKEKALGELERALRNKMAEQQAQYSAAINEYNNKMQEQEKTLRNEIAEQQARHTAAVNEYEKKLLEQEKIQIEREKTLRGEMAEQQSKYSASVTEYENKVKSLLEELERRAAAK